MTPSEQAAWDVLRNRRLRGLKFRRQHPIGPFVVDFYCQSLRLAIEIDGDAHDGLLEREDDRERQAVLEHPDAAGLTFVRLPATAVERDPFGTIEAAVIAALGDPPRRRPPGASGRPQAR